MDRGREIRIFSSWTHTMDSSSSSDYAGCCHWGACPCQLRLTTILPVAPDTAEPLYRSYRRYAKYGTGKKFLEIMETMAGDKCSNPGLSKSLTSIVINKIRAQVHVYCDPTQPAAFKKCSASDISKVGGYLMFTTKPTKSLKATEIRVQGMGGVTYSQLILVVKNLKPL